MEEKQIRDFVHRVMQDEGLRKELASDPDSVVMREDFSPRVSIILKRLAPYLSLTSNLISMPTDSGYWLT